MSGDARVRLIPVRELGEVRMGKQLSPDSRAAGRKFPYLRVANVLDGRIDYSDVKSMGFTEAERNVYSLRPGDILLNEGQSLELVGRSAIYDQPEGAFCFQNTLVRFRPGEEVLPKYAQAVFSRWLSTGVFASIAKKTTSIAHLGGDRFSALQFPLRPIAEQRHIVEVVDALSGAQGSIEEEISKRAAIIEGMVEDLVVHSVQGNYVPLGDVAKVASGVTLGREVPSGVSVELPYLRVANVQDGAIDCRELKKVRILPGEVERYRLRKGDLLLTEGGDFDKLGRGAVWDGRVDPCLHQNHVFRVRCGRFMNPHFLALFMASSVGRRYFLGIAQQTTNLASINSSQLKGMPVPCPGVHQQQKIVEVVGECESQKVALLEERVKLQRIRQGVLLNLLA